MRYLPKQSETAYQEFIKEMILEDKLGWKNSQITEQQTLQLGSTERLVPDLVVRKDERNSFILEVKKPGHQKSEGDINQLLSYMKQLEIPVGLYWGDEVYVYWKTIGDGSSPVLLLSLNFNVLCEDGNAFVTLFAEENYNVENILDYKNELLAKAIFETKVNELKEKVTTPIFQDKVKNLVSRILLDKGFDNEVVRSVMENISVSIILKSSTEISEEDLILKNHGPIDAKISSNKGTAQRYAYGLIRQIIEKNRNLNFEQLYAIFQRKNRNYQKSRMLQDGLWLKKTS